MHPYWTRDPDTGEPKMVTLKDIVLHDMIRETGWTRPIYFAVTVEDFSGYYDNLSLEGMVFKLVPETERHQVNAERTWKNVYENYRYDSIVDKENGWRVMDEVHKTDDTKRLITNYAAGFARLGFRAMQADPPRVDEALEHYTIGLRFAPEYGPALNGLVAIYAVSLRQPETALPFAQTLVETQPGVDDSWIRFGGVHLMIGERLDQEGKGDEATPHYEEALKAYEYVLKRSPEKPEIYPPLLAIYQRLNREQQLNDLLELWQRYAPDDFQRALDYGRSRGEARTGG